MHDRVFVGNPTNIIKQGIACIPNLKCSRMTDNYFQIL